MLKKSLAFLAALTASASADGDTGSNVGANGAPAPATPVISYARIDLQQVAVQQNEEGELMENAIITGVYANYSPIQSVSGVMVIAEPLDACAAIKWPEGIGRSTAVVFLARLSANSTCTAMEQNKNAKAAGAAGIVNMAPDPTSNYIWILQGTARDSVSGSAGDNRNRGASVVVDPSAVGLELIPHVAVSGVSGTRLYGRLLEAPGTVYITSQNEVEPESGIMVMDLAITIVCITVAVLVLMYAYRVGRSICINEERWEEESFATTQPDPELQARLRQRVSQILIQDLPVHKYKSDAKLDIEGIQADGDGIDGDTPATTPCCTDGIDCAICLEELEEGNEVRKLICDHVFHKECIDPWLLDHHNCPLCKDDIMSPRKLTERMNSSEDIGEAYFVVDMSDGAFDATAAGGFVRDIRTPPPRDRRQSPLARHAATASIDHGRHHRQSPEAAAMYDVDLQQQYVRDNISGALAMNNMAINNVSGMVELFPPTPEVEGRVVDGGGPYHWEFSEYGDQYASVNGVSAERASDCNSSRQVEDYGSSDVDADLNEGVAPMTESLLSSPSGSAHSFRRQNNV